MLSTDVLLVCWVVGVASDIPAVREPGWPDRAVLRARHQQDSSRRTQLAQRSTDVVMVTRGRGGECEGGGVLVSFLLQKMRGQ